MMRRWGIINALLALMVGLLGLEIFQTWARALPPIEVEPRAAAPERRERAAADTSRGAPAALVAAITAKDLFDPTRRAPTQQEAAAPTEQARQTGPPEGITITGVRIFGKDREVFLVDANQGNQQRRLRIGDQIAGYTVKGIESTQVTMASPSGDPVTMLLEIDGGKAAAAAPGAPTPGRPSRRPTPTRARATATPAASPAAGVQGESPAAGVQPPPPAVPARTRPERRTRRSRVPEEVRQKLEQLREGRDPRIPRQAVPQGEAGGTEAMQQQNVAPRLGGTRGVAPGVGGAGE